MWLSYWVGVATRFVRTNIMFVHIPTLLAHREGGGRGGGGLRSWHTEHSRKGTPVRGDLTELRE